MSPIDLENAEGRSCRTDELAANTGPRENSPATDYYEILRIAPQADEDTIERVYRTLADRFHPGNLKTGDPEIFLRLNEAYETLSDRGRRRQYNLRRENSGELTRFQLSGREFFNGVRGGQNRRLAVLCLLYRRRISSLDSPGLSILELEQLTGCLRDELTSALWYLNEKTLASIGEFSAYSITADGFDVVESKVRERLEFRALATLSWQSLPAENGEPALIDPDYARPGYAPSDYAEEDSLPLDIETAIATQEGATGPDHYEILGIDDAHADHWILERVYRTLADRFHPDNSATGNAKAFERIRDAYETLSDRARRTEYDALRQSARRPAQFRLESREFFDGVRGEQLRRLAVLCLLYRQEAAKLAGLTLLDLEQSTGCTREELGSALWYLREKKCARLGDYSQYGITAVGFDVVESKLEEREAARSRTMVTQTVTGNWLNPEILSPEKPEENRFSHSLLSAARAAAPVPTYAGAAREPISMEETPAMTQPTVRLEDHDQDETELSNPWTWLRVEDTHADANAPGNGSGVLVINAAEAPAQNQSNVTSAPHLSFPLSQSPGVNTTKAAGAVPVRAEKRVVFSMGGKGGVGKTSVMTGLAEWFEENQIPVALLDLDTENKARGSLTHFFDGSVPKINIHTPAGLDAFVDILAEDAQAILADMGAGSGQIAHDWFHKMYPDVAAAGVVFTAVGVVTSDPASVESVLNWAAALDDRVAYIIVENNLTEHTDFTWWQQSVAAEEFRRRLHPAVIRLDYRLADLENAARNYGTTLGRVARRAATAPELQKASLVMRAQSARRRMFMEFDKVRELLLP